MIKSLSNATKKMCISAKEPTYNSTTVNRKKTQPYPWKETLNKDVENEGLTKTWEDNRSLPSMVSKICTVW